MLIFRAGEFPAYAVQACGDSTVRQAGDFGDIVVGTFVEPHHDDGLLQGVELRDEFVHVGEVAAMFVIVAGHDTAYGVVEGCGAEMAAVASVPGDTGIDGGAVDPGGERALAAESREAAPQVDHGFLIEVVEGHGIR